MRRLHLSLGNMETFMLDNIVQQLSFCFDFGSIELVLKLVTTTMEIEILLIFVEKRAIIILQI